ncbi:hypothetical protein [Proteiniphilum sp. X52]|uniref:hypothetical protein n=1 Tax=Proteiniphilum sp. X52 TaxID=2382159 RepID=UPI000F0A6766|nr:hypothetical protein [Proteiniphilum sp. X52]RNC63879.1 hypothetical protein D7D25_14305 [Proteiniphilum sp. X52]
MNLLTPILSEILVFELNASGGVTSAKTSTARYSLKDSAIILREIDKEKFDWTKKKNGIALVFITGSDVGSKEYEASGNDAISKIVENENLLWTTHEVGGNRRIDFIRKSTLGGDLDETEAKGLYIAGTTVSRQTDIDMYVALQEFYEKKVSFDLIKKSREFRAFFFDSLFEKIKLPMLLFFFALLFANYVVFSNIKEKYDISETTYNIRLQKNKIETENREKTNRLFSEYNKIQSYPLALISDRIASYMPKDIRLSSMVFFPEKTPAARGKTGSNTTNVIVIRGKAGIAGTVLLFAQYLQEDKLFSKVDIININNLKDTGSYDFEIDIIL